MSLSSVVERKKVESRSAFPIGRKREIWTGRISNLGLGARTGEHFCVIKSLELRDQRVFRKKSTLLWTPKCAKKQTAPLKVVCLVVRSGGICSLKMTNIILGQYERGETLYMLQTLQRVRLFSLILCSFQYPFSVIFYDISCVICKGNIMHESVAFIIMEPYHLEYHSVYHNFSIYLI